MYCQAGNIKIEPGLGCRAGLQGCKDPGDSDMRIGVRLGSEMGAGMQI